MIPGGKMRKIKVQPVDPFKLTLFQREDLHRLLSLFIDELAAETYENYRSRVVDCCMVVLEVLEGSNE